MKEAFELLLTCKFIHYLSKFNFKMLTFVLRIQKYMTKYWRVNNLRASLRRSGLSKAIFYKF